MLQLIALFIPSLLLLTLSLLHLAQMMVVCRTHLLNLSLELDAQQTGFLRLTVLLLLTQLLLLLAQL